MIKINFESSNKKGVLLLVLILTSFLTHLNSQVIRDLTYKFTGLDETGKADDEKRLIKDFWDKIKFLDKYERDQIKFNGEVSFGLNGDDGDIQDQLKLNSGIKVSRGIYPGKLQFSSNLGVVINNKKFNEDVSNIYLAYDYHPQKNSLALENFAFLSRFTDGFLGVQQRYEVGVGTVFAYWSKELTDKGEEDLADLNKFNFEVDSFKIKKGDTWLCRELCTRVSKELKLEDVENLVKSQNQTKLSIKKLFSKFRGGVLVGVLFETEKVRFTDSISVLDVNTSLVSRKSKEVDFDVTQKIRWEIRPTLDFRPSDSWSLKFRPYFKLPMPWRWYEYEVNGSSNKKIDYRIDFNTTLSINLAEASPNKSVGLDISYDLYYDNAPQRRLLTEVNQSGTPILFHAGKLHQVYRLGLKIGF